MINKKLKINDFGYTKIDFLIYGNPTKSEHLLINEQIPFYHLFKRYTKYELLKNSSQEAIQEIKYLISKTSEYYTKKQLFELYTPLTENFKETVFKTLTDEGIKYDKSKCLQIIIEIEPLITSLKYYYNQIRPHQLALIHNQELYPIYATCTPAFPSDRVFKLKVLSQYLKKNTANDANKIDKWFEKLSKVVIYTGSNTLHQYMLTSHMADNLSKDEVFFNKFHSI